MTTYHEPHANAQEKKGGRFTTILTIVTILFVVIVAYKNMDNIYELLGMQDNSIENMTGDLQIGQQISVEGVIGSNGDMINYTHTLATESNGILGLKSRSVDLNQYIGVIAIEGIVEKGNAGIYIIEALNVIGNVDGNTGDIEEGETTLNGMYIEQAGIYFPEEFFDEYILLNQGENEEIKIQRLSNNQEIVIDYFACKKGDSNTDCTQLKNNFKNMSEKTVTTNNKDSFYKLADLTSRFVTNNLFGYFINDIPDAEVTKMIQYIILPNQNYIKANLSATIPTLCTDGVMTLEETAPTTLTLENNKITLKAIGMINDIQAECTIHIDPSLPNLGEQTNFHYSEAEVEEEVIEEEIGTTTSSQTLDVGDVDQFPINLEKTFEFTSSRGFKIIYPSMNIAFEGINVSTNLDTDGVNCYAQTNVIKYSNKDQLQSNPTVKVYECNVKDSATLANKYISTNLGDGKTFIIEAVDPAWVDFANNIVIE